MPKKRITILEPYDNLRESLKLILGDDYDLLFVSAFDEALSEIGHQKTDLFILDIQDEKTGLKRIEETKRRFPDLTILVTTVNPNWPFKEKAVRTGKVGIRFQDKPFESKELKDRVELIINGDPDWRRSILRVPAAKPDTSRP